MSLLRLESVTKSFRRGPRNVSVLKGVSLEVKAGELVAVYGRRGAGKTTLLKIAAGFEAPETGSVEFDGENLNRPTPDQLARLHRAHVGWVERAGPRSPELTMRLYVALPLYNRVSPREAHRRATAALTRVGAESCGERRWSDLSDAERMLVAVAHALVRAPKLLIVDDPTAGLGIIDRERIVGLLRTAAEGGGLGVLMAVPDMPSMLHAHQVRSLSRGRLISPTDRSPNRGDNVIEFSYGERSAEGS